MYEIGGDHKGKGITQSHAQLRAPDGTMLTKMSIFLIVPLPR